MTVKFNKFNKKQYENFKDFSIQEYAKDFIKSNNYTEDMALKRAEDDFNNIIPQGLDTPDNYFFSIVNEKEEDVGYIWYLIDGNIGAFICDLFIKEDFRRKGYASQTLDLMEHEVKQHGCKAITLNVFDFNIEARALYEKCGYKLGTIVEEGCRYLRKELS